ncbi:transposase, partial [Metamycoplasma hyosynoviae]|uniref:IS1634 family transposase n=2 Tax=Metamycoplasma hyosynoviae TaxID=29559 RepID=UPI000460B835
VNLIYKLIKKLEIFNSIPKTKHKDLEAILEYQISSRIIHPNSIISSFNSKYKYDNNINSKKDTFYSLLDVLNENQSKIFNDLNKRIANLTGRDIELVFYDSSTVYFETFEREGLRYPGYSKDGKFKEDQVVVGMATDANGIPIHIKLFKGNTTDVNTFIPFVVELKKTYNIKNITIIADKGMSSNRNIRFLEDLGINFIISYRAKAGSEAFKKYILDPEGYEGDEKFRYKESYFDSMWKSKRFNGKRRRRIITWSESRSFKDAEDRKILIDNFKKRQDKEGIVTEDKILGIKKFKFFKKIGNLKFKLDYEKIQEDEQFDGIYVYETSRTDLNPEEIVAIYHKQWQIEENFRTLKNALKIRPIYVNSTNHIFGHFVLCFLALVVIKYALFIINKKLEEDYGLLDKITNKNFIDAIESATVTISYYGDNEMERKYHTNDSNLINYENYKIFEKIISKISM